ncbi:phage tail tube protein [Streptomyces violascens]|uniref:phage tail tube protein n=1 Tax=Streptomyces violascens TaxID=67381 RepID=UPI00364DF463
MQVKKYSRRGVTRVLWLKAVADPGHVPTRPELAAGTDLTSAIAAIDGWSLTNQAIETPDLGSTFESKIPGTDQADDSSLGFYEDQVSDDIEQLLAKDATGWVVFLRKGDVPSSRSMDVFPVRIGSRSPNYSTDNEAAKFTVSFSITEKPTQDAVIPPAGAAPKADK